MNIDVDSPVVCICIPTYNAELTIKDTLTSILNQTYKNTMIQIVDNCSTDGTLAIVRSFEAPRITIYEHTENIGGEGNFNRCIQLCKGDYTAIYHADDLYAQNMVQKQVEFLQTNTEVGAVFTEATFIDEASREVGVFKLPSSFINENSIYDFPTLFASILKHSNFLFCPSAMVRTDIYKNDIKAWRGELFATSSDLDVWFRIAKAYSIGILPLPLLHYRISSQQWSAKVRRSSTKADFFLVMDYYLSEPFIKQLVTSNDLKNYNQLERRDRVIRAVNFLLQNKPLEAKSLCYDIFSLEALYQGLRSKRGALTFFLGGLTRFFIGCNIHVMGKVVFQRLLLKLNK